MDKYVLGWPREWDHQLFDETKIEEPRESLVRIAARHKSSYRAITVSGQLINCHLTGKFVRSMLADSELPVVGDWCVVGEEFTDLSNERAAQVVRLLPRRSKLARMGAGTDAGEQILATNIDIVFIVTSATRDFNVNRLRRFILLAVHGNARPIIVLSKIDLLSRSSTDSESVSAATQVEESELTNRETLVEKLKRELPDVEIIATSSHDMTGIDLLQEMLSAGVTAVFVGSSGVGKSTLVNILLDDETQKTKEIRQDVQKGRHTTSASQLFFVEQGGIIIDTPGLREVGLIADVDDLEFLAPSVSALALKCRFRNCTHTSEPGCAVQNSLDQGELPQSDLDMFIRLEKEADYNRRKLDSRLAQAERNRWKQITVQNRRNKKSQRW